MNGVAPYAYEWEPPATAGATTAERRVCPTATTTYRVDAPDTRKGSGEFQGVAQKAQASVTVTVSPSCTDGGLPGEDGGAPGSTHEICSKQFALNGDGKGVAQGAWWSGGSWNGSSLATDASGNVVLVGAILGTVDFGGGPLASPEGRYAAFVAKFDANCAHVWSRLLTGPWMNRSWATAVETDRFSNIVVAGSFLGTLDLGKGPLASGLFTDAVFVLKMAPDGSTTWAKSYASSQQNWASDLAVDREGNVVATGYAGSETNVGGGPLVPLPPALGQRTYVVKLDSAGAFVWSKSPSGLDGHHSIAAAGSDLYVLSGATDQLDWGDGKPVSATDQTVRFLMRLDAAGTPVWTVRVEEVDDRNRAPFFGGAVVADTAGNAIVALDLESLVDTDGGFSTLGDTTLRKVSPSGTDAVNRSTGVSQEWQTALAVDPAGNVLQAGSFLESLDLGGGRLVPQGGADVVLVKRSGDGRLVWSTRLGTAGEDGALGIAADPSGNIFAAGFSYDNVLGGSNYFLVKMAP